MANIIDVAREARVSPATVSRALNNSYLVTEEKRARVLAAAEKLGYQLPVRAPAPEPPAEVSEDGGLWLCVGIRHPMVQDYLSHQAQHRGRSALQLPFNELTPAGFARTLTATVQRLRDWGRLEAIVLGREALEQLPPETEAAWEGVPCVWLGQPAGSKPRFAVSLDYSRAAYDVVCALREAGCRTIRLVTRPGAAPADNQCVWGYRAALRDTDSPEEELTSCEATRDGGTEWTQDLLAGELPDVLLFTSDLAAVGCLQALYRAGIRVPERCAVLSLGSDSGIGYAAAPMLSSVDCRAEQQGRSVVQLLDMQLSGNADQPCSIVLPHTIFCRGSSPQLDPARWPVFD